MSVKDDKESCTRVKTGGDENVIEFSFFVIAPL